MKRTFALLSIGGVAVLAAAAILTTSVSLRSEGVYMTDGPAYNDIAELTQASTAVVQVKVVGSGKSYVVPFDKPQVVTSARPNDGLKSKDQSLSQTKAAELKQTGLLHTDFTVEVVDSVRGNIKRGERLTITQLGGTEDSGTVIVTEHDSLMQVGAQELMFLRKDAASGKFVTTGGGQGRFTVQSNGTLTPVDQHSKLARLVTGKPASFVSGAAKSAPQSAAEGR